MPGASRVRAATTAPDEPLGQDRLAAHQGAAAHHAVQVADVHHPVGVGPSQQLGRDGRAVAGHQAGAVDG